MKILYLTTSGNMNGLEKMLYELSTRISHDVLVCTIKNEGNLIDKLKEKNIRATTLGLESKIEFWKVFRLIKIIKEYNPDIIQSFLFFDNIIAKILGTIFNIEHVITGQRNVNYHRSELREFIDRLTTNLSDYIISNTKKGKELLGNKKNIIVIPNGINLTRNTEEYNFNLPKDKIIIGTIGRITKQKGLDILIKEFKKIRRDDLHLVIVGEGEDKKELDKNYPNITFTGRIDDAGNTVMKHFDLFVLSSRWEGMPNVILEAMKYNIPVISTNVGGVSEIIKDNINGYITDHENLSNRIVEVLDNPKELKNNINDFSIEKMIEKFEYFYKTLDK